MSIIRRLGSVHLFMVVALVALTLVGRAAQAAPAAQGGNAVTIQDFKFEPQALTVAVGTTVTWTNRDQAPHTATSQTAGAFDTGDMQLGESKSVTLNQAGTFAYFCEIHPNMTGTLTVTASAPASAPATTLPNTGISSDAAGLLACLALLTLLLGAGIRWSARRTSRAR